MKHSDESFTATPDAYRALAIHTIETYGTEERDLVSFLAMRVGQWDGRINRTDFKSWEDAVRGEES